MKRKKAHTQDNEPTLYFIINRTDGETIFASNAICIQAVEMLQQSPEADIFAYAFHEDTYCFIARESYGCSLDTFVLRFEHKLQQLYEKLFKREDRVFVQDCIKTVIHNNELKKAAQYVYYLPERSDIVMDGLYNYPWRYNALHDTALLKDIQRD